jgi:hypothetical protein
MKVVAVFEFFMVLMIFGNTAHAQWTQITGLFDNGLHDTPVTSFAVSGQNIYAGSLSHGGVVLSTDSGKTWVAVNNGLSYEYGIPEVYAFAASGTNLFAGTGDGVFLSRDSGASWVEVNAGITDQYGYGLPIGALAVIGTNLFAANYVGVFLSTNGGASWIAANVGLIFQYSPSSVYTLAASGTSLFAGTSEGVFRSTNNAASWTAVNNGLADQGGRPPAVKCFVFTPVSGGSGSANLFAGTDLGVFLSTDEGATWTAVCGGWTELYGYNPVIALALVRTDLFAATYYRGILRSSDNGASWTSTSLTNTDVRAFGSLGGILIAGSNGGGIFRTTDGGVTWTGGGRSATQITSLAVGAVPGRSDTSNLFAGTYWDGVYLSSDSGTRWTQVGLANTHISALAVSDRYLLAGTYDASGDGASVSSNSGTGWTKLQYSSATYAAAIGPTSGRVNLFLASSTNGHTSIDFSTDNGGSWTGIYSGWYGGAGVHASGNYIFTYGGGSNLAVGGVRLSSDNGTTWSGYSDVGMPNVPLTGRLQSFAALPSFGGQDGMNIFAATLGGVLRSSDNGRSWTRAGLTDTATYAIEASGTNLFAGTGGYGVYCSTDGGTSWAQVNDGLPNGYVFSLVVSGTHLYAAPRDRGYWRRPLSEMPASIGIKTNEVPRELQLLQNYPNPFNPSTTIRYGLPQSSEVIDVRLTVYDLLGREVAVLVNEPKTPGSYEAKFDSRGLATGMYLYRLQAGGVALTRKLMLVK